MNGMNGMCMTHLWPGFASMEAGHLGVDACEYVYICVCMYVCMYVCVVYVCSVCTGARVQGCIGVSLYGCMYICGCGDEEQVQ